MPFVTPKLALNIDDTLPNVLNFLYKLGYLDLYQPPKLKERSFHKGKILIRMEFIHNPISGKHIYCLEFDSTSNPSDPNHLDEIFLAVKTVLKFYPQVQPT